MKTVLLISLLSLAPTAVGAALSSVDESLQEDVLQELHEERAEGEPAQAELAENGEAQPPTLLTDEESIRLRQDFERAIQAIEIDAGAFDAQLVEPLGSLSELLSAAGEHEQALRLAMRALHINRINNGFYQPNHLKLVDRIIAGNAALQRWEDLDNNYAYYYWLSQRAFPDEPARQAAALERVFDWKLVHLALQTDADRSREILELEDIADQRVTLMAEAFGEAHPALVPALYQRALVHYLYFKALDENNSTGRRLLEREHRYPSDRRNTSIFGEGSLLTNKQSHPAMTSQLYRGRKLIELIGTITATGDSPASQHAHAMALLYRADWELLMGRRGEAVEGYRTAYAAFLEAGVAADRLESYFARPLVLPRDRFLSHLPEPEDDSPDARQLDDYVAWTRVLPGIELPVGVHAGFLELRPDYLDVRLDLNVDGATFKTRDPRSSARGGEGEGNTEGLEILNQDAVDPEMRRKATQELRLLTFRPRLIHGEAVPAQDLRMRFFLPRQH